MSPNALADPVGKSRWSYAWILSLFAIALYSLSSATEARAQRATLVDGAAIVTTFAGFLAGADGQQVLDPDGMSLRAIDLSNIGTGDAGSRLDLSEILSIKAGSIGQVFAIAVDGDERPAIFLGATSLYGLYRTPGSGDWDPAMWGRNGGPGTIYRLHPDNGYQPEAFTDIRSGQRDNSGPGLGDIAIDADTGLMYVSDLESGLIHSVDIVSGEMVAAYDHGVDGRTSFLDPTTYTTQSRAPVRWNLQREDAAVCENEPTSQSDRSFMSDPACRGYASFQRRVFALGIQRDADTDAKRLYYSIWGSAGFDDPAWDPDDTDSRNTIWSIALDVDGAFDLTDVRREIIMPSSDTGRAKPGRFAVSQPVVSIVFTADGAMLVAERNIALGLDSGDANSPLRSPVSARVLRFEFGEGKWVAKSGSGVGAGGREGLVSLYPRAASSGGIALGYGYDGQGRRDPDSWGSIIWVTGDGVCSQSAPCGDTTFGGLQGIPVGGNTERAPVRELPQNPPPGSGSSYFVGIGNGNQMPASLGDIAILKSAGSETPATPVREGVDLALTMLPERPVCRPNSICSFSMEIINEGRDTYRGPLMFENTVNADFTLDAISPNNWNCINTGEAYLCYTPDLALQPGRAVELGLSFFVEPGITSPEIRNCAVTIWPGQGGRAQILAVQIALQQRGFDPGSPDGVPGPRTRGAILNFERANGLSPTGLLTENLLENLFGPNLGRSPDINPGNNSGCAVVELDIPSLNTTGRNPALHSKFRSNAEDGRSGARVRTHNRSTSRFHERYRSSMYRGGNSRQIPIHRRPLSQFHQTDRSGRHDGTVSRSVDIHDPDISRFHNTYQSSLHNRRTSRRFPVHVIGRSEFHQTSRSWVHDGTLSQQVPAD